MAPRDTDLGAVMDISARIAAARAIVACLMDYLPNGNERTPGRLDMLGDLAQAALDVLYLAARDADALEQATGGAA